MMVSSQNTDIATGTVKGSGRTVCFTDRTESPVWSMCRGQDYIPDRSVCSNEIKQIPENHVKKIETVDKVDSLDD